MDIFEELKKNLESTNLSENEIGVYIALLRTGESKTGKILNEYKMSAGKVYIILDKLIKKGLVSYVTKGNVKHFKAHNPKNILEYLEKEKKEIDQKEKEIKNLLPKLINSLSHEEDGLSVEIYEGFDGFRTAVNKVMDEHEIGATEYEFDNFDIGQKEGFSESVRMTMIDYSKKMIKKKITLKLLVSTTNKDLINDVKYMLKGTKSEIRYIKGQKFASILFTKDKTLILDFVKPNVIFIRNKAIAEGFIKMFEAMWTLGKEV